MIGEIAKISEIASKVKEFNPTLDPDKKIEKGEISHIKPNEILNPDKKIPKELSYQEKITLQDQQIADVKNGKISLELDNRNDHRRKGRFGEMVTDQDLRKKGYDRISLDMVTDIDQPSYKGIDGVYYNKNGHPPYLIVDAKFGSSKLNEITSDGKQMSEKWIENRLYNAVGKEKAFEIEMANLSGNVGTYVSHVDKNGNVTYDRLDKNANIIEIGVKINA